MNETRSGWLEERLKLSRLKEKYLRKAFPVHLSFFFGEIALFSFVILILTGIYLAFFYEPSARLMNVKGESVPASYHSILTIDSQAFGLIVRQVHHWAAHLMIAAALLHLLRVFFTGAYKRPREINWLFGCVLLLLTVGAAFSGYLLPYDSFAVTATGIGYGMVASIPWIGATLASFFFAGTFPSENVIPRFYGYHIMLIPLLLIALLGIHLLVMIKQKHSEPIINQGKVPAGRLIGIPLWPHQASLMTVLFLVMTGGLLMIASIFPVHPVEVYGPPSPTTPLLRPDWYLLWVYGLLKLIPGWMDFRIMGGDFSPEVIGGILLPGLIVLLVFIVPFIDRSNRAQHYLERLSEHAARTATGVGFLALFTALSVDGYQDVLGISLDLVRFGSILLPLLAGLLSYWLIKTWQQKRIESSVSIAENS